MIKVGEQIPYFEFLEGIKGKNLYDVRQKYILVIYNSEKDLDEYEDKFEKLDAKLIDYVQILTKDFCKKVGCDENEEFIIIVDRYGTVQFFKTGKLPEIEEILDYIYYLENEGCCNWDVSMGWRNNK